MITVDRKRVAHTSQRLLVVTVWIVMFWRPELGTAQQRDSDAASGSAIETVPSQRKPPGKRPEFRKRLTDDEFSMQFTERLKQLGGLKRLENREYPAVGSRIASVAPDGQARRLGLKVDDVIFRVDDQWVWTAFNRTRKSVPQQLQYYRPSSQSRHTIRIEPGLIGVGTYDDAIWFPENVYSRSKSRNEKWDREVLVGIMSAGSDPDLAETAWQSAIQAGYPRNFLSAAAGATIALAQGRTSVASEFAFFARQCKLDEEELVHPLMLYRVAIADGQWADALDLVEEFPEAITVEPAFVEQIVALQNEHSIAGQTILAPNVLASKLYRDNLMSRLRGVSPDAIANVRPKLERGYSVKIDAPTAQYQIVDFDLPEPVDGIDFNFTFTIKPTDSKTSQFYKHMQVGLFDRDAERFTSGNFLTMSIHETSLVEVSHNNDSTRFGYIDPMIRADGSQQHSIRIVRAGGLGEIFLDGKRVLYTPVDESVRNLSLNLKVVGITLNIVSYKVDELIERID